MEHERALPYILGFICLVLVAIFLIYTCGPTLGMVP